MYYIHISLYLLVLASLPIPLIPQAFTPFSQTPYSHLEAPLLPPPSPILCFLLLPHVSFTRDRFSHNRPLFLFLFLFFHSDTFGPCTAPLPLCKSGITLPSLGLMSHLPNSLSHNFSVMDSVPLEPAWSSSLISESNPLALPLSFQISI